MTQLWPKKQEPTYQSRQIWVQSFWLDLIRIVCLQVTQILLRVEQAESQQFQGIVFPGVSASFSCTASRRWVTSLLLTFESNADNVGESWPGPVNGKPNDLFSRCTY